MTRYKNKDFQRVFDAVIVNANTPTSEMYHNGIRRRGALHRIAFWNGADGMPNTYPRNTFASVFFYAGKEWAKTK